LFFLSASIIWIKQLLTYGKVLKNSQPTTKSRRHEEVFIKKPAIPALPESWCLGVLVVSSKLAAIPGQPSSARFNCEIGKKGGPLPGLPEEGPFSTV
jgi:hypothetical protein